MFINFTEIKNHYITKNTGSVGRAFNNCLYRRTCPNRGKNCDIKNCSEFVEEKCSLLDKPPYVCNGCKQRTHCTLYKRFYNANYAQEEYEDNLKESRSGVVINQDEINHLNNILVPLIKEKGQSIHNAVINNKNKIIYSENKIYKLIDLGLLDVRNIDLPRKVRFRQILKTSKDLVKDPFVLEFLDIKENTNYLESDLEIEHLKEFLLELGNLQDFSIWL